MVDRQGRQVRRAEAHVHEAPGGDPALWVLVAVVLVLLALALGTWLALVLPAAF